MSLPIKSDALEVVSGGAANPSVTSGTTDPTLGLSRPEGSIYLRYVIAGGQAFIKFGPLNTDWVVLATGGGGIGGSLDDAYDFSGAGLGRTIVADSGSLQLDAFTSNTQAALTINRQPGSGSAAVGIDLVLSGNVNASGVGIQIVDAGIGTSLRVTKSNAGSVYFADLTNAGAKALEVVVTAAPTSVSPVSIVANTTGTTAALLSVSKIPGGSTAGDAISVSMGANTTGAGISSTTAGSGPAVAGTNSSSSAGAMAIRNTNVLGPVDFYAIDSGGTSRMSWGYGNASYSDTARVGRAYVWRNTGVDFVLARTNVVDAILKADGKLGIGTATALTAQLEVNGATPDIFVNGSTSSFLRFPDVGAVAPTFTTRSAGTRIVLWPQVNVSNVDYAIGIASATLWCSVPVATSANHFRWYGGTTERMNLRADGVLAVTQSLADPADGTGAITLKNTLSTSIVQMTWQKHTGVFQAALGHSNAASQGQLYWYFDSPTSAGLLFSGPGGTNMNIFAGVANGAGFQLHSGSAVVVSDANTGRMRYVTAGQKFQFSLNGGAYVDVPTQAAAFTAGSVPFANATGQLAQNNPMLFWDNTQHALLLYTDSAGSANGPLFVRSTVTTGPGAMGALDIAGAFKSYWGHYNSTYAFTYMRNKNGILTDNSNIIFGNLTVPTHEFGMTAASVFLEMFNGGSAAVSTANAGRIRYNIATQTFQVSLNGAAYTDLQTGASFTLDIGDAIGSSTVGSVLFVGAGNVLQQDNANFLWDDTNNRLNLIGTNVDSPINIRNQATGYSMMGALDSGGVFQSYWGYANASSGVVHMRSFNAVYCQTADLVISNSARNEHRFGAISGSSFHEMANGSGASVSAVNAGRIRYNTTGQKFEISSNGTAYVDLAVGSGMAIGGSITSATAGSVLFAGVGGILQQDNANFFWNDTDNTLGLGTLAPLSNYRLSINTVTGGSGIQVTGANTASYSGLDFYNSTPTFTGSVGYGGSTVAIAHLQGRLFHYSGGADWVFANATRNEIVVGMVTGSTFLQMENGSVAAVSDASTGRIRYTTTGQKFQVSTNGGAYVDLATGTTTPSVERLSVDGAAGPAVDRTFVSGTGTDLTLANGTIDGFIKSFVVTGGTGTITPANLADGDVLTWTAAPANVDFIWDATAVTWHVLGNPYNMVTT